MKTFSDRETQVFQFFDLYKKDYERYKVRLEHLTELMKRGRVSRYKSNLFVSIYAEIKFLNKEITFLKPLIAPEDGNSLSTTPTSGSDC